MFEIIACVDSKYGIGMNGGLPWSFKTDMELFKSITKNKTCIFGYNTWKTLPDAAKDRLRSQSYVFVNNQTGMFKPDRVAHIREDGFPMLRGGIICGGEYMYRWAFEHLEVQRVYLTKIDTTYACDRFFPKEYLNWYHKDSCYDVLDMERISKERVWLEYITYTRRDLI